MLNNKFWQGFFALAPLIVVFALFCSYLFFIFSIIGNLEQIESSENASASIIFGDMVVFFVLIMLTIFISVGSLIFYIMHAVQNENLKQNNLLIVWILLFVFVGGIGQLIYWIVEIIQKKTKSEYIE